MNEAHRMLWAKSSPPHPLWCHLIDVGAVASVMWDNVLATPTKERLARALGLEPDVARCWFVWLAALHDVGKASPEFQAQDEALSKTVRAAGLGYAGKPNWAPHGALTTAFLERILPERGWSRCCANRISTVVGAHHGKLESTKYLPPGSPWEEARTELVALVESALQLESTRNPANAAIAYDAVLLNEWAGLISAADWIGSSAQHFPTKADEPVYQFGVDPRQYALRSLAIAADVLREFGWRRLQVPSGPRDWRALFQFDGEANALQQTVEGMLRQHPRARMLLIEAPMGEGKTEAALYAARHWMEEFQQPGMYLGLPTQATSNAMYKRVDAWLSRCCPEGGAESLLVHGGMLKPGFFERKKRDTFFRVALHDSAVGEDSDGAATTAHEWFLPSKRALLAHFGTGTIDQALLGAMMARHWFVRLAGLAGKTVILDEVHAYDAYTSRLIARLLEYLSKLDCTVVLLSATLPEAKRREFLEAFGCRLGEGAAGYPRVSCGDAGGDVAVSCDFETSDRARKSLRLECAPWDVGAALEHFIERLGPRGCGAFICNTVAEAQKAFLLARERHGESFDELLLFHSRFPAGDRARIEEKVLSLFGKEGCRSRGRALLIATQVVEQSLDLDFDIMASAIAPVDLLLQRSGRLHRHPRPRPEGLGSPMLLVRMPDAPEGVPDYGRTGDVYAAAILERTHALLLDMMSGDGVLAIPSGVRAAIEAVYSSEEMVCMPEPWREGHQGSLREFEKLANEQTNSSEGRALASTGSEDGLSDFWQPGQEALEDDVESERSNRALTRLGEPTVGAVCLHMVDDVLCFDGSGHEPIPIGDPTTPELLELLRHVVRMKARDMAGSGFDPPKQWQRNRALRHLKVLRFVNGRCQGPKGSTIEWDPELGVHVRWPKSG